MHLLVSETHIQLFRSVNIEANNFLCVKMCYRLRTPVIRHDLNSMCNEVYKIISKAIGADSSPIYLVYFVFENYLFAQRTTTTEKNY